MAPQKGPVNIFTVVEMQPEELAAWLDENVLSRRLPVYSGGEVPDLRGEVVPLLATFANDLALITSMYNATAASSAGYRRQAKDMAPILGKDNEFVRQKERVDTLKDILYRTIQALTQMYEATSRSMTGYDSFMSYNKRATY